MFTKKYTFETKETRAWRKIKNLFFFSGLMVFAYFVFCTYLVLQGDEETKRSESSLFNRPPDLIVVFTGDKGRISFALEKAREYRQSHIFVSGVYEKNTVNTLFPASDDLRNLDSNLFDLDYASRNTFENVLNTVNYINRTKGLNRILVVSHDYHIPRIKLVMEKLMDAKRENAPAFFYWGLKSDTSAWRNAKIIVKESFKIFRTIAILLFWEGVGTS